MLRVAESAYRTDTGRQRSANEDSYFARAPVFAVADGMGGAQAGEVASRIAAEAFEPGERRRRGARGLPAHGSPRAPTRGSTSSSQQDSSRSGMGTTLTAALVDGDEVAFAHVGDSRAYVLRDGELKRLTTDHSLVEELRRQGRLTEQQAEEHPQRSIITRALGPEPDVEVDTMTYPRRPGDVFLLCSDGLTTMVTERADQATSCRAPARLDEAVERLVDAANEAAAATTSRSSPSGSRRATARRGDGGRDSDRPRPPRRPGLTRASGCARRRRSRSGGRGREPPPRAGRAGSLRCGARRWRSLAVAGRRRARLGARQVYFLGTDEGGRVALYRGLPYELPFGDRALHRGSTRAPVQVELAARATAATSAIDHELRGTRRRRRPARGPRVRARSDASRSPAPAAPDRGQRRAAPADRRRDDAGRRRSRKAARRRASGPTERAKPAMSARNRELLALIPVALLVTGGLHGGAARRRARTRSATLSLIYGGYFLARLRRRHIC